MAGGITGMDDKMANTSLGPTPERRQSRSVDFNTSERRTTQESSGAGRRSTLVSIVSEGGALLQEAALGEKRKSVKRRYRDSDKWHCLRANLFDFVESTQYNLLMATMIVVNVIHAVHETDLRASSNIHIGPLWMSVLARIFLVIYSLDLLLRIYVFRSTFLHSSMNCFDSFTVVLDIFFLTFEDLIGNIPSMSVLRGLRMLRIVRVIRNLVAFRELYLMMQGLVSAVRAIIFGTTLIVVVLIMWSILAVELVQKHSLQLFTEGYYGECERCEHAFASVGDSMLTFTSTIIAGDSWGVLALPLVERHRWTAFIIFPALLSLQLGLMNVVAAVIVDRQAQARQEDEKFLHQMHEEDLKKSYGRLQTLFSSMDEDYSGSLTLDEMLESYNTHIEFKELLELMDITTDDLELVFAILDKDRSGDVSYNEFVEQLSFMRTVNGHTLLVFIRHLAAQIHEKVEEHDRLLEEIHDAVFCDGTTYTASCNGRANTWSMLRAIHDGVQELNRSMNGNGASFKGAGADATNLAQKVPPARPAQAAHLPLVSVPDIPDNSAVAAACAVAAQAVEEQFQALRQNTQQSLAAVAEHTLNNDRYASPSRSTDKNSGPKEPNGHEPALNSKWSAQLNDNPTVASPRSPTLASPRPGIRRSGTPPNLPRHQWSSPLTDNPSPATPSPATKSAAARLREDRGIVKEVSTRSPRAHERRE